MPRLATLALACCALTPSACRTPAPYVVPETRITGAVPAADSAALRLTGGDTTSVADLPWWRYYNDPALQGLVREAIANNQDLKLAVARVQQARGHYRARRAERFPALDAGVGGRAVEASPELQESGYDLDRVLVGVDLSYEVDLWGRLRGLSDAARNDLLAGEEATRTVYTTLVSDVARAYFELRSLDEELAITERRRGVRQESVRLVSTREGGGVSSLLEVHQAEAELTTTAAQVPELRRRIALKEHELSMLLGRIPGPIERAPFRDVSDATSPPFLSPGLPSQILARRPDIRAAERQLAAQHARVEAARAAFFPKITLDAFIGLGATAVKTLFDRDAFAAALSYGVFQPIFDPGRRKGRVELERGRREEALAEYQKTIQQAFREVADATVGERRLREVRQEQDHLVTVLTDAQRLSDERYKSGVTSYLEVLDVSRQLYNAELSRARTRRDQLVTSVQLYRALGGGWRSDTTTTPGGGGASGRR